jgi:NAD(P) transhydrogenase subunit alpha
MVEGMSRGAVVVDLAAERGGNCELTRPGETVVHNGVTILGPLNLPAMVPHHSSQLYAKNISTFLLHLVKKGALEVNLADEITAGTLVAAKGKVVHPAVLEAMGAVREGGASS